MNKAIDEPSKDKLNVLKVDFSLQDTEEEIIRLDKAIKRHKERRLQMVLGSVGIAFIVFIILIAPDLVDYRFGYYPFVVTVAFFMIIAVALFIAFSAIIIFQSLITSLESSIDELKAKQRVANLLNEEKAFHVYVDGGGTVNLSSVPTVLPRSSPPTDAPTG